MEINLSTTSVKRNTTELHDRFGLRKTEIMGLRNVYPCSGTCYIEEIRKIQFLLDRKPARFVCARPLRPLEYLRRIIPTSSWDALNCQTNSVVGFAARSITFRVNQFSHCDSHSPEVFASLNWFPVTPMPKRIPLLKAWEKPTWARSLVFFESLSPW